jgi:hypothetical protein
MRRIPSREQGHEVQASYVDIIIPGSAEMRFFAPFAYLGRFKTVNLNLQCAIAIGRPWCTDRQVTRIESL